MPPALEPIPRMRRAARFDPTRRYRYSLRRRWGVGPACCFVMLNPSAADERDDDPTIRRCIGFAQAWGFPALEVVNLFAWRTHEPRRLRDARDPIGPGNDDAVCAAARLAGLVVCAWGAAHQVGWPLARRRVETIVRLFGDAETVCLGRTKGGHPRHPLYLRADAKPKAFEVVV